MAFFTNIIDFFKKGFKKKVYLKTIHLKEEEVERLDKDLELDRGEKSGTIAALQVENYRRSQASGPKEKEINIPKFLSEQSDKIYTNRYDGAFSFKKFFTKKKKKPIKILSYNLKKRLAYFEDFAILNDGQISVWGRDTLKSKDNYPVISGSTTKDILRDYKGLSNTVSQNIMVVNLDEYGKFAENVLETKIPTIILDKYRKINFSKVNEEEFMQQLIRAHEEIQNTNEWAKTLEKALLEEINEKKLQELRSSFNAKRASTAESALGKDLHNMTEMLKGYHQLNLELTRGGLSAKLSEDENEVLDEVVKEVLGKLKEKHGTDVSEEAERKIRRTLEWAISLAKGFPTKSEDSEEIIKIVPKEESTLMKELRKTKH